MAVVAVLTALGCCVAAVLCGWSNSLFDSLDQDGSGELGLDELLKVVFPLAK